MSAKGIKISCLPDQSLFYVYIHVMLSWLVKFNLCLVPLQSSQGGGHRTLLYGHAILLRHHHSGMVRQCK